MGRRSRTCCGRRERHSGGEDANLILDHRRARGALDASFACSGTALCGGRFPGSLAAHSASSLSWTTSTLCGVANWRIARQQCATADGAVMVHTGETSQGGYLPRVERRERAAWGLTGVQGWNTEMRHRHDDHFVRLRNDLKGIRCNMSEMTACAARKMTRTELTRRHWKDATVFRRHLECLYWRGCEHRPKGFFSQFWRFWVSHFPILSVSQKEQVLVMCGGGGL